MFKNRRGQFQIMTSFMVLAILMSAVLVSYNRIQDNPFKKPVTLATDIKEVNTALHELLGFTAGYYGSIIKLTGNVTYAQEKTDSYFESGLETIAHSDMENSISLLLRDIEVSTNWFGKTGFTRGELSVDYSLPSLGLQGMKYSGSASLNITIIETVSGVCRVKVLGDRDEPNLLLTKESFSFFKFDNDLNTWSYILPTIEPIVSNTGIYSIKLPPGIPSDAYFLQVEDQRGITASCGYVRGIDDSNKDLPSYTYSFNWNQTLYNDLNDPNMEIELLQNGTLRWLGQSLVPSGTEKPIPPIPVKGIHLNQTIDGVSQEVPFQIEDWGANYQVPFGMTSNTTIFNENCMIVFLVNHHVSEATLWWDGSDQAVQTTYAYRNIYFTADNPTGSILDNGVITLDCSSFSSGVKSTTKTVAIDSWSNFFRVNVESPIYGSDASYTIHHGVVRDIVQQEPEWGGGVSGSSDMYGHVVLTLPAGTSYYTYRARLIYVPTTINRDISELSVIQLKSPSGYSPLTENGVQSSGVPIPTSSPPQSIFYDGGSAHQHQWSEYISSNRGVGLMMRPIYNDLLYTFDDVIGQQTGAISINTGDRRIELNPIERYTVNAYKRGLDRTWVGAVVNFSTGDAADTIFPTSGGTTGLWVLVESPPTVTIS